MDHYRSQSKLDIKGHSSPSFNRFAELLANRGLADFESVEGYMYYINGHKLWAHNLYNEKECSDDTIICTNHIKNDNSIPSIYVPNDSIEYFELIDNIKRSDDFNIMWCGASYRSSIRNPDLMNACDFSVSYAAGDNENNLLYHEYMDIMMSSRFCLCLQGFGPKCHREIEAMGVGTVPVLTKGCCTKYHNPLIENYHYVTANTVDDISKIKNIPYEQWSSMSKNCLEWFNNNIRPEGAYQIFNEIIDKLNS